MSCVCGYLLNLRLEECRNLLCVFNRAYFLMLFDGVSGFHMHLWNAHFMRWKEAGRIYFVWMEKDNFNMGLSCCPRPLKTVGMPGK